MRKLWLVLLIIALGIAGWMLYEYYTRDDNGRFMSLEEAIVHWCASECGYVCRVYNKEKRISAINYCVQEVSDTNSLGEINKRILKHSAFGERIDFHFDQEGRVIKIDNKKCVSEIEYFPVYGPPYRNVVCHINRENVFERFINLEIDSEREKRFYLEGYLPFKDAKELKIECYTRKRDSCNLDADVDKHTYYQTGKNMLLCETIDTTGRCEKSGFKYLNGKDRFTLSKICFNNFAHEYVSSWIRRYSMREGRVFVSFDNRFVHGYCELWNTFSQDKWEYLVVYNIDGELDECHIIEYRVDEYY